MAADLLLINARVITMDAAQTAAEIVAITGDRISAVGPGQGPDEAAGAGTRVIDCGGLTVLPGFHDAHLHIFSLVQKLLSLDVGPPAVRSIEDIKEVIRDRAAQTPPGTWLRGSGYNEFYLAEGRCPTRRDLDEAAPDHPVVLSHRSLHAMVLNSLALALIGIGRDMPEPPGGRIERDLATGEPNGILIGFPAAIPPFTPVEFEEGVRRLDRQLLSFGITSIQDATYKNDPDRWQTIRRWQEEGQLHPRVTMMAGPETRLLFEQVGMITGAGDIRLRLGAVKFLLDISPDQEEINNAALESHLAGWQLAFHAIAESTVEAAVTALEYVNSHSPTAGRRHRVEHCGECPPRLLERLSRLGAVIVTQPTFIYSSGERYLATVDPAQLPWLYRIRSLLEAGLTVAGSSDAPVAPLNPLVGIYAAVTRRAESGQVLLPEEAILPEQALAMYTSNAAYAAFEEDDRSSISPGRLADIIVLSDDPARVPPERIKDIKVVMTIVGREVVWEG